MILGIGIDIVHIDRMARWNRIPGIVERFFHPDEIREARRRGKTAVMSLAARFAAKEAFGKALGTGLRNIHLKDIHVINDPHGKPGIRVDASALKVLQSMGGQSISLSLTHDHASAIAVVIIEG